MIRRYDNQDTVVIPNADGKWVLYRDHLADKQALYKRIDRLADQIEYLRSEVEEVISMYGSMKAKYEVTKDKLRSVSDSIHRLVDMVNQEKSKDAKHPVIPTEDGTNDRAVPDFAAMLEQILSML